MTTLLQALLKNESGGRNIANTTQGTSSGQAQGFFQITTGTWKEFARKAGIDLNQYPTPMVAPYDVQAKVASVIPLKRWDESTVALMRNTGIPIDPKRTLGENLSAAGETFAMSSPAGKGSYDPRRDSPSDARPRGIDIAKYADEHPVGPAGDVVTTSPYSLPAPGTADNPLVTKQASNPFEKAGAAVAKLGAGGGGQGPQISSVPNPPTSVLPPISSVDPAASNNQRQALIAALMRLNSGQLFPAMGGMGGMGGGPPVG